MHTPRTVLLIIGGGIAAYKSLELIRRLKERGIGARAILTAAGAQFVTPLSVSALTGGNVYQDLFSLTDEAEMGHIQLSRSADLVVVAPATADLLAKLAGGHANDLASTTLLATNKRVLVAPAMNVRMWDHPATQRNMALLKKDGVIFVGPDEGEMACGEFGLGRMAEPKSIADAVETLLAPTQTGPLSGKRAIVTAGPTQEPIDPVRFIANHSSGKQGYAIADALAQSGAETTLISGPVQISPPSNVRLTRVQTAQEMLAACQSSLPADIAVFTAAVSDWRSARIFNNKIKKRNGGSVPDLQLQENPDILSLIAHGPNRPELVVGFAAETENVVANAQAKRVAKSCDWIVANDVSAITGVMGGDINTVHLITQDATESWPPMSKREVGQKLAEYIAAALGKAA